MKEFLSEKSSPKKIARVSTQKIDPATGVRFESIPLFHPWIDFWTTFPIWYKISVWFVFRTCFGNKTIRRQFCKRDLDAANLRPALEQS